MILLHLVSEQDRLTKHLLSPDQLYRASDVLKRPCAVPASPGIYAWYFTRMLGFIRSDGCHKVGDHVLLYMGISPKAPPDNGRPGVTEDF